MRKLFGLVVVLATAGAARAGDDVLEGYLYPPDRNGTIFVMVYPLTYHDPIRLTTDDPRVYRKLARLGSEYSLTEPGPHNQPVYVRMTGTGPIWYGWEWWNVVFDVDSVRRIPTPKFKR